MTFKTCLQLGLLLWLNALWLFVGFKILGTEGDVLLILLIIALISALVWEGKNSGSPSESPHS